MTNHANRGMNLETLVEYANARYRNAGLGIVEKQNTKFIPIRNGHGKIVSCKVEEKATVDFMGRYLNVPVAIEAKHTSGNRISFNEVKYHQAEFLDDFVGSYGVGFGAVLVSFNLERYFLVPWDFWRMGRIAWNERKERGKKQYTIHAYGCTWTTPGKASVSADELLPEWEVKPNNKYVLPYLSKIDTYRFPRMKMKEEVQGE